MTEDMRSGVPISEIVVTAERLRRILEDMHSEISVLTDVFGEDCHKRVRAMLHKHKGTLRGLIISMGGHVYEPGEGLGLPKREGVCIK